MSYHKPVLLQESVDALHIVPDGTYVDATFGGGGHSSLILEKLGANGRLIAFDQDEDAKANVPNDPRLIFVPHNFRHIKRFLRLHRVHALDGVLADLGVSSFQLDESTRGFSYRMNGPLDMRMGREGDRKASDLLNHCTAEELQDIFSRYGEVRNARSLAQAIVQHREHRSFEQVADLMSVLETLARGKKHRYYAQVFQALRIEVNDEMGALKEFLQDAADALKPGGRMVVIAYHSIEDRLVKRFFRSGRFDGKLEKDDYGHITRPFEVISRKAITPPDEELKANPRSRSAKMRIAEKK